ncbi:MAG TPA: NAD(+) synthase [Firmicutes bacterium]|nr:NAD(+) synthase [Bacillota bacterium]
MFSPAGFTEKIIPWLRDAVAKAGAKGLIFGLSGGIDSAVIAALAKKAFPENAMGLIMPCHSNLEDEKDALLVAAHLDLPVKKVILDGVFNSFIRALQTAGSRGTSRLNQGNLKPRLRMATLYFFAAEHNFLVAGASNKSELETGYFTKHGDGAVDLMPLGSLVKKEIMALAFYLSLPEKIIAKPPSGGLWEGQTDEQELGISYETIDNYLLGRYIEEDKRQLLLNLQEKSRHKRVMPPIPDFK